MTLNREQEDEWSNKCNSGYREVDHQQRKNQQNEWEIEKTNEIFQETKVESIVKRLDKSEGRILGKDKV